MIRERVGLPIGPWQQLLNGSRTPTLREAAQLAAALGRAIENLPGPNEGRGDADHFSGAAPSRGRWRTRSCGSCRLAAQKASLAGCWVVIATLVSAAGGELYAPNRPRASTGIRGFSPRTLSSCTAHVLPSGSENPKNVLPS